METIKFKTDIKCSGCLAKVTPFLDEAVGAQNWQVNIDEPSKLLTVAGHAREADVKAAVTKAGFKAELL